MLNIKYLFLLVVKKLYFLNRVNTLYLSWEEVQLVVKVEQAFEEEEAQVIYNIFKVNQKKVNKLILSSVEVEKDRLVIKLYHQ